jgi:biopolymer transport protein ExbD
MTSRWRPLIVPICAGLLAACGVSAEEHQSTLDELAKVKAEAAGQKREADAVRKNADEAKAATAAELATNKLILGKCQQDLAAKAAPAIPPPPPPEVLVTVSAKGYVVGEDKVKPAKLEEALKKAKETLANATLKIKVQPAAKYSAAIKVIDAGKAAGFERISVATE